MSDLPQIHIPKEIWSQLVEEAKNFNGKIKAFGLFSERGKRYFIKEMKEIEVEVIKENSDSGPIFRFRNQKEKGFYPSKKSPLRYVGTVIIQDNLDLSSHYAYWMGREKIDFNINLKLDENGSPRTNVLWVNENTHGEFLPIEIKIE